MLKAEIMRVLQGQTITLIDNSGGVYSKSAQIIKLSAER